VGASAQGGAPASTPFDNLINPPAATAPTNSVPTNTTFVTMETLDDKHKLALGDKLSFRIVEDQEDPNEKMEPKPLVVSDHGQVEVPYIGPFPAAGKTCKQLAREIKAELEKDYYYRATVIIGLDLLARSTGKVYVLGEVKATGPVEVPGDEVLTVGKAILRAGGFTTYSDKKHVKVTRKGDENAKPQTLVVNVSEVLEKGMAEKDITVEVGDVIYVPTRLINF
jgi:protein involved in polysaccharide export with SLBB domain